MSKRGGNFNTDVIKPKKIQLVKPTSFAININSLCRKFSAYF